MEKITELENKIYVEKYRPRTFENLILSSKELLLKYLQKPKDIPSFIFVSRSPGTGKTSTAKLISKYLNCDVRIFNSSDERGIDTIRYEVKYFSQCLSSQVDVKRMVFMDEADGLTRQAQDSLRNLMEEYSDNVFFILTANDIDKIIEPIRSRCITISFETPNKAEIVKRLEEICKKEDIQYEIEDIHKLTELHYPDLRSMIMTLQSVKIDGKSLLVEYDVFNKVLQTLLSKNAKELHQAVISRSFDTIAFTKWFFRYIYLNSEKYRFEQLSRIATLLADILKERNTGTLVDYVFLANMLQISKILAEN